jgi:hypothetical protein
MRVARWQAGAPVAFAAFALLFAAITGHTWEDYLITFRSSLNLAQGHGLVFQPGERIHSFTSPLGTLLPAGFALLGGDEVAGRALWGLRAVSAFALGGALALALAAWRKDALAAPAVVFVSALWLCDPKTLGFAINGMETGLLVLAIVAVWHALHCDEKIGWLAVAVAALQWTRPDGVVFFAVLGLAWLVFAPRAAGWTGLRAPTRRLLRAGILALLLYLPWLAWAAWYYGSPVPHTIFAKVAHHAPGELLPALAWYPVRLLFGSVALHDVFLPAYHFFGGWPAGLAWFSRLLVVGAALAWLWPRVPRPGRVASLAFCLGGFYVEYIPRSPWYQPGWQTLAFLAWAYLAHTALAAAGTTRWRPLLRIAGATALAVQAALLGAVTLQLRAQQAIVEDGHRREIGRWLHREAAPGDRVFLECLGYIGYHSQLKMLDFPGLASPEVVAARRQHGDRWSGIVAALRPEWLVLRPWDADRIFQERPDLAGRYARVREFDVRPQIDALALLPGRGFLRFDAVFHVYRLQPAAPR